MPSFTRAVRPHRSQSAWRSFQINSILAQGYIHVFQQLAVEIRTTEAAGSPALPFMTQVQTHSCFATAKVVLRRTRNPRNRPRLLLEDAAGFNVGCKVVIITVTEISNTGCCTFGTGLHLMPSRDDVVVANLASRCKCPPGTGSCCPGPLPQRKFLYVWCSAAGQTPEQYVEPEAIIARNLFLLGHPPARPFCRAISPNF